MKYLMISLIRIGGEKEWDLDFQHMKRIGIDTVIMIRSGYRKFITYPSKYLLKKGCYMPSVDLVRNVSSLGSEIWYEVLFWSL